MSEHETLLCPRCQDVGPVQKVTAIVLAGTSTSTQVGGGVALGGVDDILGGLSFGTSETALTKKLVGLEKPAEPSPPVMSHTPVGVGASLVWIGAVLLGLFGAWIGGCGLLMATVANRTQGYDYVSRIDTFSVVGGLVLLALGIGCIVGARKMYKFHARPTFDDFKRLQAEAAGRDREEYVRRKRQYDEERTKWEAAMQVWNQAMHRWHRLYYCSRCDGVFIPGEGMFTPIEEMHSALTRSTRP